MLNGSSAPSAEEARPALPLLAQGAERPTALEPEQNATDIPLTEGETPKARPQIVPTAEHSAVASPHEVDRDFYGLFLVRMLDINAAKPMKADDIASRLELKKSQTNAWLKQGVVDGQIKKTARPASYQSAPTAEHAGVTSPNQVDQDFYGLFLVRMLHITAAKPMKADDIASRLELEKSQTNAWLKRGVFDGKIKKATKPVRYQSAAVKRQQASLFEDN